MATPWFPTFSLMPVASDMPYAAMGVLSPTGAWLVVASAVAMAAFLAWLGRRYS